ncbi:endonuclease domain-containing 1 protein [Pleuronectes platessa]|uniref:endonuclease domain-containing 1 protein n=1 Tax=Pleuronectes platessa TaxID=8262 RepID=UPI00232A4E18|nr:endonuclease domain-containing 1 protein [Pleuronectes platessa]
MPFLLPLLALLLLSAAPTVTEVVTSMSDCDQYFLNQVPPQIGGILEGGKILDQNRYKPICQTLRNLRTFVTLYDTTNKIPVFSAYKYIGNTAGRPQNNWMTEPQLEEITLNANMEIAKSGKNYTHQADKKDYNNTQGYNRGHLLPSSYGFTRNEKTSTFTLTNIVPQVISFNNGSWRDMETCVRCVLDTNCINNNNNTEGFVVIGARPGNNFLNNKVNIPSMLWSAFCCYSSKQKTWLAGAHWGKNKEDNGTVLQTKTLDELRQKLGGKFEAFPGTKCRPTTTVTHLYPQLSNSKDCNCPPYVPTTSGSSTPHITLNPSLSALLFCSLIFLKFVV